MLKFTGDDGSYLKIRRIERFVGVRFPSQAYTYSVLGGARLLQDCSSRNRFGFIKDVFFGGDVVAEKHRNGLESHHCHDFRIRPSLRFQVSDSGSAQIVDHQAVQNRLFNLPLSLTDLFPFLPNAPNGHAFTMEDVWDSKLLASFCLLPVGQAPLENRIQGREEFQGECGCFAVLGFAGVQVNDHAREIHAAPLESQDGFNAPSSCIGHREDVSEQGARMGDCVIELSWRKEASPGLVFRKHFDIGNIGDHAVSLPQDEGSLDDRKFPINRGVLGAVLVSSSEDVAANQSGDQGRFQVSKARRDMQVDPLLGVVEGPALFDLVVGANQFQERVERLPVGLSVNWCAVRNLAFKDFQFPFRLGVIREPARLWDLPSFNPGSDIPKLRASAFIGFSHKWKGVTVNRFPNPFQGNLNEACIW